MPSVPAGSDVVVMTGGEVMLMVTAADAVGLATEVAVTVAVGLTARGDGLWSVTGEVVTLATAPAAGAL